MELTLKSVKIARNLSEETLAYTARVYVDGVPTVDVQNDGRGGCDYQHPVEGAVLTVKEVNDWCKANLPKMWADQEWTKGGIEQDLEIWCHEEAERQDAVKAAKSTLRRTIVVQDGDNLWQWIRKKKGVDRTPAILKHIGEKYPHGKIVNDMPLDDAVAVLTKGIQ